VRKHDVDVVSLVVGLLFLGSALIWGLDDDPGDWTRSWQLPTLLIAVGVLGLVTGLVRRRGSDRTD
jgi:hypothetical protein